MNIALLGSEEGGCDLASQIRAKKLRTVTAEEKEKPAGVSFSFLFARADRKKKKEKEKEEKEAERREWYRKREEEEGGEEKKRKRKKEAKESPDVCCHCAYSIQLLHLFNHAHLTFPLLPPDLFPFYAVCSCSFSEGEGEGGLSTALLAEIQKGKMLKHVDPNARPKPAEGATTGGQSAAAAACGKSVKPAVAGMIVCMSAKQTLTPEVELDSRRGKAEGDDTGSNKESFPQTEDREESEKTIGRVGGV